MDSIFEAQADMRLAYRNGAPGIFCSGSVWCLAGIVAWSVSPIAGIITLVAGGTLIFPASLLLCRIMGCSGKHQSANPLAPLAIAGTIWMLMCIPIAGGAAFYDIRWFFPAMLLVIGSRYFTFTTLYGKSMYWLFGAVLIASGFLCAGLSLEVYLSALIGGIVELVFGVVMLRSAASERQA